MHYWLYGEGVAFGDVVCEWSLIVSDYKLVTSNGPKSFRIKRLCYRNEKLCNYAKKNRIVFEYYSTLVSKASPFIVI